MPKPRFSIVLCTIALAPALAAAAVTIAPLSTFGGGDGWLSPGEGGYTYLGTSHTERGLAYGNAHLYLVSRSGGANVRILDPATGADLGALDVTGVSGGTFAVNTVRVGGDGAIYVGNLTTNATTSPFKLYRWANESATPQTVYSGAPLAGGRVGDSLAAIGSGASTRIAAGFGSNPSVAGNNGYAIIDPNAGTSTQVAFAGKPPEAGDFRLSLTFTDESHVIGTQSATYRYTSFSDSTGTLIGSGDLVAANAQATAERLMAYAVVGGMPLLAIQSIGDSHVSLYDVTDPASPVFLVAGNNTTGTLTANTNGTGQLTWNITGPDTATLYAMSTNQGIQAFNVVIPEPATLALLGLGLGTLFRRRSARS